MGSSLCSSGHLVSRCQAGAQANPNQATFVTYLLSSLSLQLRTTPSVRQPRSFPLTTLLLGRIPSPQGSASISSGSRVCGPNPPQKS